MTEAQWNQQKATADNQWQFWKVCLPNEDGSDGDLDEEK